MVGYIGERAKRRRRNFILFFILILLILIIYYFIPLLKLSDVKPTDNLLPSEKEMISPQLQNTVEDLNLEIFDKEQKIIFRNNQIEKLKNEIKILNLNNKRLKESIKKFEDLINASSSKQVSVNKNQASEYKNRISKLKLENQSLLKKIDQYKIKEGRLKEEYKYIFSKNLNLIKLNEEADKKMNLLNDLTQEQNLIIQLLKDKTPHG